jgi:putative membrane protein
MSDQSTPQSGPVLIELDDPAPNPSDAPPVPDPQTPLPEGRAMSTAAALAARPVSPLAKWFWRLALTLLGTVTSIAAWNYVTALITANPLLGWAVSVLLAGFLLVLALIALKEIAAFSRMSRVDHLQHAAREARANDDLKAARKTVTQLTALYAGREDTRWGRDRLKAREAEMFDGGALLDLAERELLSPLDAAAEAEVQAAARQVATVTALVPLALADVMTALTANLRMIRRIAEIYSGRSGTLGSWRLTRAVLSHLVATGAVAVGDDLLEPILGGGLVGKLSRRFGEGLVNGALTARVGVAAIEVCRPMPFAAMEKPSTRKLVRGALGGLFTNQG